MDPGQARVDLALLDNETFARDWLVFGACVFADDVPGLAAALGHRGTNVRRSFMLLEGLVGIGARIGTLAWPSITPIVALYVIAARALVTSGFEPIGHLT